MRVYRRALTPDEVAYWVAQFASNTDESDRGSDGQSTEPPPKRPEANETDQSPDNPFPPGYGEDLPDPF